jgi:polysaccharide pyruvyl transferase WcaK-like protein/Flp pilus assembly protein TadD
MASPRDPKAHRRAAAHEALLQEAVALHRQGRLDEAEALYARILRRDPPNHRVINLVGLVFFQRGDERAAVRELKRAATLAPRVAKYRYDLGVVEQSAGEPATAAGHYEEALRLDPALAAAWENLGVARFDLGDNAGAAAAFERALGLAPGSRLALGNLATLRRWQGRHGEALALLDRGLAADPLDAELRMKRAEALLATGDYARGWDDYAWRFGNADAWGARPTAAVPLPAWSGEPLAGRRVVVHAEQGIGDEVMFAGCLGGLAGAGADVTLLCDPRLAPSLGRSFPFLAVRPNAPGDWGGAGEALAADLRIPLGDLAAAWRRSEADFARAAPYLRADQALRDAWRARLAALGPGRKVGISWRGGATPRTRQARSVALAALGPLLARADLRCVSLQYGDCAAELAAAPAVVRERLAVFPDLDPLAALEPLLALVAELDLVITVDNSTVHFAGALGVPAWLLLPALADWRWPATGDSGRWYPSVRLFRQPPGGPGDWAPVVAAVGQALEAAPAPVPRPPPAQRAPPPEQAPAPRNGAAPSAAGTRSAAAAPSAPAPAGGRRVLLLNDTSAWYHWGCSCTSLALRAGLAAGGGAVRGVPIAALAALGPLPSGRAELDDPRLFDAFARNHGALCAALEQADEVVVNGEGTLHGVSRAAIGLLYLAWLARRRYGRRVRIVNHSCYPDDRAQRTGSAVEDFYRQVYEALDGVAVREPVSATLLESLGIHVTRSFDCLPLFAAAQAHAVRRDPGGADRLLLAGSVADAGAVAAALGALARDARAAGLRPAFLCGAAGGLAADDRDFARRLAAVAGPDVELLHATSEAAFLSAIASARLLVSGRFHYSIAAACLGTPFVALDSNTPKMDGLMALLGVQARLDSGAPDLAGALAARVRALVADPAPALVPEATRAALRAAAARNF